MACCLAVPSHYWIIAILLSIRTVEAHFNGMLIKVQKNLHKKMTTKMLSTKLQPFCSGLNVSINGGHATLMMMVDLFINALYKRYSYLIWLRFSLKFICGPSESRTGGKPLSEEMMMIKCHAVSQGHSRLTYLGMNKMVNTLHTRYLHAFSWTSILAGPIANKQ